MDIKWVDNFMIEVSNNDSEVVISANAEGLESMANIFMELSKNYNDIGTHIHLDQYNSLEDGSAELIIVKTE